MNLTPWLESAVSDLKYGFRQLLSTPAFTAVAVLSLALGIGANSAIFQLVNAIRLKTLPVHAPEKLLTIDFAPNSARGGWWSTRSARFTSVQYEELRRQQQAFSDVFAWSAHKFNLANGGEARYAEGLLVSGNFFRALGVAPALGRTLLDGDDTASCNAGAVLSDAFWQREFAGDPSVIGRTVSLNGHQMEILGVTQPSFFGVEVGYRFDVAVPLCADALITPAGRERASNRVAWWLSLMGRLKPDWTEQRANQHLAAISPALMQATLSPEYKPDLAKRFLANKLEATGGETGVSNLRRQYERPLWLLMATTALVLLIACANLANLLLARATVRQPEIAVRLAIGASRWRLVRQLLSESLLLAVGGAVLGWVLAAILSRALIAFISTSRQPLFVDMGLDWRVLGFTTGLAVLTCLLFGLLPAIRATWTPPVAAMRSGGRSVTAGRERFALRRSLVVTQIALSLVLLVGALLFIRSLNNLLTTNAGFNSEGVMVVNLDFQRAGFAKERRHATYRELQDRLRALPGVLSVAQVAMTPVSGSGWDNSVGPDSMPAAGSPHNGWFNRASPGYFQTMGTGLLAGRDFDERDNLSSPKVAIVNEVFAKKFFGTENVVGRTFHLEAPAGKPESVHQIVGIVRNAKYYELREDFRPVAFFPTAQEEDPRSGATFVVRLAGSPSAFNASAKEAVTAMNPLIGLEFQVFSAQIRNSVLRERLMATLSGGFALLAGLLATIGLYGVISYMVARRRSEIGIRIALGADRAGVIRLVLREAVALLCVGLVVGIVLALSLGQTAASMLFGLQPRDAVSMSAASALMAVIALVASYVPARRAASMEPIATLRTE